MQNFQQFIQQFVWNLLYIRKGSNFVCAASRSSVLTDFHQTYPQDKRWQKREWIPNNFVIVEPILKYLSTYEKVFLQVGLFPLSSQTLNGQNNSSVSFWISVGVSLFPQVTPANFFKDTELKLNTIFASHYRNFNHNLTFAYTQAW